MVLVHLGFFFHAADFSQRLCDLWLTFHIHEWKTSPFGVEGTQEPFCTVQDLVGSADVELGQTHRFTIPTTA